MRARPRTFLTLVVVPVIYSFFEWLRHIFSRKPKPPAAIVHADLVPREVPPPGDW